MRIKSNKIMEESVETNKKITKKMPKKKKRLLQCYLCSVFIKSSISNLRRHIRLHGPIVCCFKCSGCGEKYQNKANLEVHWAKKHKADLGGMAQMTKSERLATGIVVIVNLFFESVSYQIQHILHSSTSFSSFTANNDDATN